MFCCKLLMLQNMLLCYPITSMYDILTYMWLIFMLNVGKYTIHGCYGLLYFGPLFPGWKAPDSPSRTGWWAQNPEENRNCFGLQTCATYKIQFLCVHMLKQVLWIQTPHPLAVALFKANHLPSTSVTSITTILLTEEILHLGCIKPRK